MKRPEGHVPVWYRAAAIGLLLATNAKSWPVEGMPDSQRTSANEAPPGQRAVSGTGSQVSPNMVRCVGSVCGSTCRHLVKMSWNDIKQDWSLDRDVYAQCVLSEMTRDSIKWQTELKDKEKPKDPVRGYPPRDPGRGLDCGGDTRCVAARRCASRPGAVGWIAEGGYMGKQ